MLRKLINEIRQYDSLMTPGRQTRHYNIQLTAVFCLLLYYPTILSPPRLCSIIRCVQKNISKKRNNIRVHSERYRHLRQDSCVDCTLHKRGSRWPRNKRQQGFKEETGVAEKKEADRYDKQ